MKKLLAWATFAAMLLASNMACRHTQLTFAPDFSLTDFSGHPLRLADFRGKVVLLDFWASWCEPCKAETPHFIEMQNRYGSRGFQVIGISMDDDASPARAFAKEFKLNYPVALGSAKLAEQFGGILGLPVAFLIDQQGRIRKRYIGQTRAADFDRDVELLLPSR